MIYLKSTNARIRTLVLFVLCFISKNAHGQGQSISDLSTQYLSLYRSGEIIKMAKLLDEEAVMSDPTAEILGSPLEIKGKAEIVKLLTTLFEGVSDLDFQPTSEFVSGNFAVSEGKVSYSATMPDGQKRHLTYRVFTVLRFKNGLVIEHTDYADYQSMLK